MTAKELDDLDAVRSVVAALEGFDPNAQERILRWSREKLGLSDIARTPAPTHHQPDGKGTPPPAPPSGTTDIKAFVTAKNPRSDRQFAATVAYFYKFEASQSERKPAITSADLQDACRKVGRERLATPSQTLLNAHAQGYLDKAGERGSYALNTVGENLVAMTLPEGSKKK